MIFKITFDFEKIWVQHISFWDNIEFHLVDFGFHINFDAQIWSGNSYLYSARCQKNCLRCGTEICLSGLSGDKWTFLKMKLFLYFYIIISTGNLERNKNRVLIDEEPLKVLYSPISSNTIEFYLVTLL